MTELELYVRSVLAVLSYSRDGIRIEMGNCIFHAVKDERKTD